MKRIFGAILRTLGGALLLWLGLSIALYLVGTDNELYYRLQSRAGILDYAGISDDALCEADARLARCLRGDASAFIDEETGQIRRITVFGQEQDIFSEPELTHMEDCRRLFLLLKKCILCFAAGGICLFGLGTRLMRPAPVRTLWASVLMLALPIGSLALWAAVDFYQAFAFFHRMLFTNDLWLMDPNTELMIRLCPQSMFMIMGAVIACLTVIWCIVICFILKRIK